MYASPDPTALAELELFQGLDPRALSKLAALLRPRTVHADTQLMIVEQPGEVVYIIRGGTVKVHVGQRDGSDVILVILGVGEVLGEMSMLDSLGRSATVTSLEETTLWWMEREAFQECLETVPLMALNLLRIMSRRMRLANGRLQALAALDVYGRVAHHLLALAEEYGQGTSEGVFIPLRLTQSELSDLVGATRVRVNQALAYYRQSGYISMDHNSRITVHDHDALAARCL
jgi:CRP/FNR family cyclic AMP-dependent transcriptional regulator